MSGNQGSTSPCSGPFPYTYSDLYEIYQKPGSKNIVLCRVGDDCLSWPVNIELQQVKKNVITTNCAFKQRGLNGNSGLSDSIKFKYTAAAGDFTFTADFYKKYYYPMDKNLVQVKPNTWNRFSPPTPDMGISPLFGRICDQYNWPDVSDIGTGYGASFYSGALRGDNVTWVFIRDITQCPCYPLCSSCTVSLPLVSPDFSVIDNSCLKTYGSDETQCDYKIVGVGGGPMLFPTATTGVAVDETTGYTAICYVYNSVSGTRVLSADQVQVPSGIMLS